MPDILVPAHTSESLYEIKKSRFIARIGPAASRQDALQFVDSCRDKYPDARHHCYAFVIGDTRSPQAVAMSDDGEPSGTAGKPILHVLQHKAISNVVAVVIRYFGGIKLGAGGLVRAYSAATQQAISELTLAAHAPQCQIEIVCNYSQEQHVRHWLELNLGRIDRVSYGQQVELECRVPESRIKLLRELTRSLNMSMTLKKTALL